MCEFENMPIKSTEQAFLILDTQERGVPFSAIKYLYNQPSSESLLNRIIFALLHAYDGTYYDSHDYFYYFTPLWYAIVSENHLCPKLT